MNNQDIDHTKSLRNEDAFRSALQNMRQRDAARTDAVMQRIAAQPVPLEPAPVRVSWMRSRAVLAAAAGVAVAVSAGLLAVAYRASTPTAPAPTPIQVAVINPPVVLAQPEESAPVAQTLSATLSSAEPGAIVALPGGTFEGSIRITKAVTLHAKGGRVQIGARAGGQ